MRPRITIRRLMVIVLLAAFITYLKLSWDRQPIYQKFAVEYATREKYAELHRKEMPRTGPNPAKLHYWVNTQNGSAEISPDNVEYYRFMRQKYERLAHYPWMPSSSDPLEPPFDRSK